MKVCKRCGNGRVLGSCIGTNCSEVMENRYLPPLVEHAADRGWLLPASASACVIDAGLVHVVLLISTGRSKAFDNAKWLWSEAAADYDLALFEQINRTLASPPASAGAQTALRTSKGEAPS